MRRKYSLSLTISLAFVTLASIMPACSADTSTPTPTLTPTPTVSAIPVNMMVIVPDAPPVVPAGAPVKQVCIACHGAQVSRLDSGVHSFHDCAQCHTPGDHPKNPLNIKPVTNVSPNLCGGCHTDQWRSFNTINLNSPAKEDKGTPESISPLLDKLLAGHGFTVEHDEPRSHTFMVSDHVTVDRAYGGRFDLATWKQIISGGNPWDNIVDNGATYTAPGTAKAANPVCLTCKTSDTILEWAYLGNENARADWARTSVVADMAKSLKSPAMGCIMCHDPHTVKPRVIRDALIEAVGKGGTFPNLPDDGASRVTAAVTTFRDYRKIAELSGANANILCAQCHVEYSCNPGTNTATGEKITMTDVRTNQFPWVDVFGIEAHYDNLQFADFTHAVTGANLVKLQHPDVETNFGGTHQLNSVECSDCHMPERINSAGATYTSHWQASPRNFLEETCLKCHTDITPQEAEYRIDAIQNYTEGKVRDAEYWLERLIDTFALAKSQGVGETVLKEARGYHETAHIYWEWWTAENSGGFHNPDMVKKSLALSVEASKKGIAVLEKALLP